MPTPSGSLWPDKRSSTWHCKEAAATVRLLGACSIVFSRKSGCLLRGSVRRALAPSMPLCSRMAWRRADARKRVTQCACFGKIVRNNVPRRAPTILVRQGDRKVRARTFARLFVLECPDVFHLARFVQPAQQQSNQERAGGDRRL